MNWTRCMTGFALLVALGLVLGSTPAAKAQAAAQDTGKQAYTVPEYNAYQAAAAEKNPAQQIKLLDDFVSKYPNSALLVYVYPLYYQAYGALKNYPKVIEYADKLLALGDKTDAPVRYQAYFARAFAYTNLPPAQQQDKDLATKAREAAASGLKTLGDVKKPDNITDADWVKQTQQPKILFNYASAIACASLKDFSCAVDSYKAVLALNPDDAVTSYRIGQTYLAMTPPQSMDAFWFFGRAVTSKGATEAQSKQVKGYLRKLLANYQGGAVCDSLTDAELNELLQLATSAPERPASYTISSSADLDAARKDMTIASVFADLKTGGDKAKVTWLASCGLEFPDVPGKLLEVVPSTTPGDPITLKVTFVTSQAEFDAATTPNMDVKVVGQPEAARLEKDNPVRFTGTLSAYDPGPAFMLHWDKAKVNAEDIPKEKAAPKKPVRRPAPKKPGT
jgi:tetratricopeptide (TPR) repeat protein